MPVMNPPMRKEIFCGARCAKSFAGETTFAAMFVASVAMQERKHRDDEHDGIFEIASAVHRIPDRFAVNYHGRRRDRDADERIQRHRQRQAERLAEIWSRWVLA